MRKILGLCFVLCFVLVAGFAFADLETKSETTYSYHLRNNTGKAVDYLIPTYAIRPNIDKYKGFDAISIANGGHTEFFITIFDSTDSTMTGESLGEMEINSGDKTLNAWFDRGKNIVNGIAVRLGSYVEANILFVRE